MRFGFGGRRARISVGPLGLIILGPFLLCVWAIVGAVYLAAWVAPYVVVAVLFVIARIKRARAQRRMPIVEAQPDPVELPIS